MTGVLCVGTARISRFLNMPEYDANTIAYSAGISEGHPPSEEGHPLLSAVDMSAIELTGVAVAGVADQQPGGPVISINRGVFCWDRSDSQPCLRDIQLSILPGEFVGIVGSVGSGKSSLVHAILGQLERVSGSQFVRGKVAYVSQDHVSVFIVLINPTVLIA